MLHFPEIRAEIGRGVVRGLESPPVSLAPVAEETSVLISGASQNVQQGP